MLLQHITMAPATTQTPRDHATRRCDVCTEKPRECRCVLFHQRCFGCGSDEYRNGACLGCGESACPKRVCVVCRAPLKRLYHCTKEHACGDTLYAFCDTCVEPEEHNCDDD